MPFDDFIHEVNGLVGEVMDATLTTPVITERSEQPGTSTSSASPRTPTIRKRSQQVTLQSPSKRCKHITDIIDEDIERHKKGTLLYYFKVHSKGTTYFQELRM